MKYPQKQLLNARIDRPAEVALQVVHAALELGQALAGRTGDRRQLATEQQHGDRADHDHLERADTTKESERQLPVRG